MSAVASVQTRTTPILYPESDGKPMANNSFQYEELTKIKDNLEALLKHDPSVLVEGDMLWYPLEGRPGVCMAPDVFVVFGRAKGYRGSYLQWQEGGIAPQVVFEILSPSNTIFEMQRKLKFYERYGVEEYYEYDPHSGEVSGWLRQGDSLHEIENLHGWVSPRLGIRFELNGKALDLFYPDGRKFESFVELDTRAAAEAQRAEAEAQRAAAEAQRAEAEAQRAETAETEREQERRRAEAEAARAEAEAARAAAEAQRAASEHERAERLLAQLRALGIEPAA